MFGVINWIIFGLFTIALIADSAYALSCLVKTDNDTACVDALLLAIIYGLAILLFSSILSMTTPDKLGISTTLGTLLVDSIVMLIIVSLNHSSVVYDYKWQQNRNNYFRKQKAIKL